MSEVESFFKQYNAQTGQRYTDGALNSSVDGTGVKPSVTLAHGLLLVKYIEQLFPNKKLRILDVGAGVGHLQQAFERSGTHEVFSIEGAGYLAHQAQGDKSRYCVCDLSKPFGDERLYKAFDLTTSFEFLEHCHSDHQDIVWDNIKFLGDKHLCSIHTNYDPDAAHEHCCIKTPEEWQRYFDSKNIGWRRIDREEFPIQEWTCSAYYLLDTP